MAIENNIELLKENKFIVTNIKTLVNTGQNYFICFNRFYLLN